jgi:excisionase family DNA binding protein
MSSTHLTADLVRELYKTLPADEQTRFASLLPGTAAPQPPPTLLTVETVAVRWGVTSRTVRNWIASGELPAIKRGRAVRIPENAIYEKALQGGK